MTMAPSPTGRLPPVDGDAALPAVTLRDGTTLELARMAPDDGARLLRFHHTLSPDTIYFRYFGVHPELRTDELFRFTHVDHRDREAIVAVSEGEIVGVARFDRSADRSEAEVAYVVADAWQGRGLGTVLFDRLAELARAVGITRLVAHTLPENRRMLRLFHHSGFPVSDRFQDGVIRVTIDIAEPARDPRADAP
jgi:RimJ/RimL family protein N-acetyltransferase